MIPGSYGYYHSSWLYYTALISQLSVLARPLDVWGHVKIPLLNPDAVTDNEGWAEVNAISALDYSAFVGIPILNIIPGNTTLSLEVDYIRLECEPVTVIAWERFTNGSVHGPSYAKAESKLHKLPAPYAYAKGLGLAPKEWENVNAPNGTWYGEDYNNSHPAWKIGLDRFFDKLWLILTSYERVDTIDELTSELNGWSSIGTILPHELRDFAKEVGIEAGSTNLLFQAFKWLLTDPSPLLPVTMKSQCRVF